MYVYSILLFGVLKDVIFPYVTNKNITFFTRLCFEDERKYLKPDCVGK